MSYRDDSSSASKSGGNSSSNGGLGGGFGGSSGGGNGYGGGQSNNTGLTTGTKTGNQVSGPAGGNAQGPSSGLPQPKYTQPAPIGTPVNPVRPVRLAVKNPAITPPLNPIMNMPHYMPDFMDPIEGPNFFNVPSRAPHINYPTYEGSLSGGSGRDRGGGSGGMYASGGAVKTALLTAKGISDKLKGLGSGYANAIVLDAKGGVMHASGPLRSGPIVQVMANGQMKRGTIKITWGS